MSATTWYLIAIVGFSLSGILLTVAVFMFIKLSIPAVIGDLSGKTVAREIKAMRDANSTSGEKLHRPSRVNLNRGKLTEKVEELPSEPAYMAKAHGSKRLDRTGSERIGGNAAGLPKTEAKRESNSAVQPTSAPVQGNPAARTTESLTENIGEVDLEARAREERERVTNVLRDESMTEVLPQERQTEVLSQTQPTEVLPQERQTEVLSQTQPTEVLPQERQTEVLSQTQPTEVLPQERQMEVLSQTQPTEVLPQERQTEVLSQTQPTEVLPQEQQTEVLSETLPVEPRGGTSVLNELPEQPPEPEHVAVFRVTRRDIVTHSDEAIE